MSGKKTKGQFYTVTNPFHNDLFLKWLKAIPNYKNEVIVEPFAGANNIVKMLNDLGYTNKWDCYDIQPGLINNFDKFIVVEKDILSDFPTGYKIAITNPPYLAKNSAKRDGLEFPETEYDDLYKLSLDRMLQNVEYVAAIIPDSFLTANLFHNRLYGVVTLNCRMFDDTECPVCLALFVPEVLNKNRDFFYYKGNVNLGYYSEMVKAKNDALTSKTSHDVKFNDPNGVVGLYAIDSPKGKSIRFVNGSDIDSNKIKVSSRGVTRIGGIPLNADTQKVIEEANKILNDFREKTNDMFLTSFRGLREDGEYRKRLDFNTAKLILNTSIQADLEKVAERFDRSIKEKLVGAIKPLQESQVELSKKLECAINKMKAEN